MKGSVRLVSVLLALILLQEVPSYFLIPHEPDNFLQIAKFRLKNVGIPLVHRATELLKISPSEITRTCPQLSGLVYTPNMYRRTGSASVDRNGQKDLCPICNVRITHKTCSLCCEICEVWYCLKCSKVPQAAYDALVEASAKQGSSCVFLCPCCKPSLPVLSNINQTVTDIKTSTSERFDKLET